MPGTEWNSSIRLQDIPLKPDDETPLATYLEILGLATTAAANDRSLDTLTATWYSPKIRSHLEAEGLWLVGPEAHIELKKRTLTDAGTTIQPLSASATIHEPNVVAESGKGRKSAWGESRFATVYVMTSVWKKGFTTESMTILHWEKMGSEDGERWLISGWEGMRSRASSFGFD